MILQQIAEAVISGNVKLAKELTQNAINQGCDPIEIIDEGLVKGMGVVGDLFGAGQMFVPEVMMASKAMNSGMELIKPLINAEDIKSKATCVFATVKGDLHDIGKKLVVLMLEGAGFKVIDLGVDIKTETIVEAVKREKADIVGMSAMLTTTMNYMKEVADTLKEAGLENVKIMIGGAPISHEFAEKIGCNYSKDASEAVELANKLIEA